ncbi:MAG: tRNA pseudouridine(55) synthase TruB [Rikenellaceae bacterium]
MDISNKELEGIDFREGYIALIDKPLEWTSTDVVRKVKYALSRKGYRKLKVGHAGTLDPLASGVLLVCLGKATKMVDALQSERKVYVAEVTLGATTPSYDMEHEVDATYPTEHITREKVDEVLKSLEGERLQSPPIYSAKRVEGKGMRAYEMARAGEVVELRQSLITIYSISVEEFELPKLKIRVECSKGTYIRSLAHEIGQGLESGGYLSYLRRTQSGGFRVDDGWQLEDFLKNIEKLETKS